jgi:hypothetical protein
VRSRCRRPGIRRPVVRRRRLRTPYAPWVYVGSPNAERPRQGAESGRGAERDPGCRAIVLFGERCRRGSVIIEWLPPISSVRLVPNPRPPARRGRRRGERLTPPPRCRSLVLTHAGPRQLGTNRPRCRNGPPTPTSRDADDHGRGMAARWSRLAAWLGNRKQPERRNCPLTWPLVVGLGRLNSRPLDPQSSALRLRTSTGACVVPAHGTRSVKRCPPLSITVATVLVASLVA